MTGHLDRQPLWTKLAGPERPVGSLNVFSIAGGFDARVAADKTVVKPDQPVFD
jgi:hypothetical protein